VDPQSNDSPPPWEWSEAEIRQFGYQVVDLIADYLVTLPEKPVFRPFPQELAREMLDAPAPEEGQDGASVLEEFRAHVAPYPFGNGHPRFYGWINSPPTVVGVFAEALAAAMNPSCAGGNHAAIHVERQVLSWFKRMLGFPAESMGLLVSGGSMATLTALAVARNVKAGIDVRARGIGGVDAPLLVYMGQEGHSCIRKAVELLGLGSDQIRTIPADESYRMDVRQLEDAIRQDLAAGYRPIAVVASAGTVNTGAIDPLAEIAAVCRRHGLWLHVDGSYGAPAILTERYRTELAALKLADSVALDPHKWFSIPVEAGLVLVRDGSAMRDTFSLVPPYLRTDGNPAGVSGPPWFSEYGFQQTRGFRALKVWMALKYHGLSGYTKAIDHDLDLAAHLARLVAAAPDLELAAPQSLSIVCFRYAPAELRDDDERPLDAGEPVDALNRALLEEIQLSGEAFLTSTSLAGRFVLRACIVNFRSSREDVEFLVDLIRRTGARLAAATSGAVD
jgi:glutamate/tyrosine decarboxylase-like PLP-dependent enzyme